MGDVTRNRLDLTANQRYSLCQLCFTSTRYKNPCAFLNKTASNSEANTATTSGDQGDLST